MNKGKSCCLCLFAGLPPAHNQQTRKLKEMKFLLLERPWARAPREANQRQQKRERTTTLHQSTHPINNTKTKSCLLLDWLLMIDCSCCWICFSRGASLLWLVCWLWAARGQGNKPRKETSSALSFPHLLKTLNFFSSISIQTHPTPWVWIERWDEEKWSITRKEKFFEFHVCFHSIQSNSLQLRKLAKIEGLGWIPFHLNYYNINFYLLMNIHSIYHYFNYWWWSITCL